MANRSKRLHVGSRNHQTRRVQRLFHLHRARKVQGGLAGARTEFRLRCFCLCLRLTSQRGERLTVDSKSGFLHLNDHRQEAHLILKHCAQIRRVQLADHFCLQLVQMRYVLMSVADLGFRERNSTPVTPPLVLGKVDIEVASETFSEIILLVCPAGENP